jgi:acetyl esterase/lipase
MIRELLSLLPFEPTIEVQKDCRYSQYSAEGLADLYLLPRQEGPHPCVIFIHGGGWSAGDKNVYEGRAKRYAKAGFSTVAINYTLAKIGVAHTRWPVQLNDVGEAYRWVRSNAQVFGIDPNRIAVCGDSAGGHLALCLAQKEPTIKAVLNWFGPSNLIAAPMRSTVETTPLFEKKYADNPKPFEEASPLLSIEMGHMPPVCTIQHRFL